jgi:hypothetical protein
MKWFQNPIAGDRERGAPLPPQRAQNARRGPITGRQRWAFDARSPRDQGYGDFASRGVSTWQRGSERLIFIAT